MNRARHARRSRLPFGVLAALLLVAAVGAGAWAVTQSRDEASRAGDTSAESPSPTGDAAVVAPAGPAGAGPVTPSPSAEPKEPLVIHGTGDVSLDPDYIPAFRANGYEWAWSGLGGLFERDDLTIINHECPSTDRNAPLPKQFTFRCDPAALEAARRAGVEVLNLANNHGYDHGPGALLDSIRNIRIAGLVPVGAGRDQEAADRPAFVDVNGWRIAIVGIGQVLDPIDQVAVGDRPGTAVGHDFERALRAIRAAKAHADLVLVTIHWGVELDTEPRDYQVEQAREMIEAGADAIFGHHSHRLQPMDTYRGRPIFYGLGNFVWPNFSVAGSTTAVAQVRVGADGRIRGRLLPAFITGPGHPELR
ncbi:MAG TPA: CapA family protein [Actinomycetota bacterium]|nr:CapA family protein [Actinomycetota bacterium]